MKLPSAHRLPRAEKCPGSQVLPAIKEEAGFAAERGSRIHEFLQNVLEHGREAALEKADTLTMELVQHIDTASLPANMTGQLAAERLYAWNPNTDEVRCFEPDDRKVRRPELEGWVVAIADVSGVAASGDEGYVGDYKSGRVLVEPADTNLQVGFPAWCMSRLYGLSSVRAEIIYVREHEDHFVSRATLDVFALDEVEARMRAIVRQVMEQYERAQQNKPVQVNLGSWCKYCPSFHACPGQIRLINALASHPMMVTTELDTAITAERAAWAYERLKAAKLALSEVEKRLIAYAKESPIPLENGQVYGLTTTERKALRGEVAFRVLSEQWGEEVARKAVEISATQAGVERALRPLMDKGKKLTAMKAKFMDAMEAADGVTVKRTTSVREHKPKQ